jgi:hypothetical protein
MNIVLSKSSRKDKKFQVRIDGEKTIHFGATGYSDFTLHKDKKRRDRYDNRHRAREDWTDPLTAGFWAKWILWNKPTLLGSIRDTNRRFSNKLHIVHSV